MLKIDIQFFLVIRDGILIYSPFSSEAESITSLAINYKYSFWEKPYQKSMTSGQKNRLCILIVDEGNQGGW